jgi:hypothetical protein
MVSCSLVGAGVGIPNSTDDLKKKPFLLKKKKIRHIRYRKFQKFENYVKSVLALLQYLYLYLYFTSTQSTAVLTHLYTVTRDVECCDL